MFSHAATVLKRGGTATDIKVLAILEQGHICDVNTLGDLADIGTGTTEKSVRRLVNMGLISYHNKARIRYYFMDPKSVYKRTQNGA